MSRTFRTTTRAGRLGVLVLVAPVLVTGHPPATGEAAPAPPAGHLTTYVEGREFTLRRTSDGRVLTIPTDLRDAPAPPLAPSAREPAPRGPGAPAPGVRAPRRTATVVANGAWSFYMSPRVLQTPAATYIGTVTNGGTVRATRLSTVHQRMDHVVLGRVPKADDHASATFTRTPDGRIAAFWSGHGDMPVRYRVSRTPESVTTFGPVRALAGSGLERAGATYTVITQLAGEANRYWLFTRASHRGARQSWWLTTSRDLQRWTRAVQLTRNPYPRSVTKGWPYLRLVGSGHRTVDIAVTDGDPANLAVNSLFHIRYTAGRFVRSDGSLIRTMADLAGGRDGPDPLDPREGTLVHNGSGPEGRARVYDISRGPRGGLAVGMSTFSPQYRSFKWFRLAGTRWVGSTIQRGPAHPTRFGFGFSLVHGAPHRAHVVSMQAAHAAPFENEVQEWWTDDHGGSWKYRAVAKGGARDYRNAVGPAGPRPGPAVTRNPVFWLAGEYDHWTRFSTRVEMETTYHRPVWTRAAVARISVNQRRLTVDVQQGVGGRPVPGAGVHVAVRYPRTAVLPTYAGKTRKVTGRTGSDGRFSVRLYLPRGARVDAGVPPRAGWGWGQALPLRIR